MNLFPQKHHKHLQPLSSIIFKMKHLQTDAYTAVKKKKRRDLMKCLA